MSSRLPEQLTSEDRKLHQDVGFVQEPARSLSLRMPEQLSTSKDRSLYLVFDDWEHGYSIRKVGLSLPGKGKQPLSSGGPGKGAKRLRVFMRISAPRERHEFVTSGFGTKIMAMYGPPDQGVPTVDVLDKTCTFDPRRNIAALPTYIPVGDDRLFALDICIFQVLWKPERWGQPWVWQHLPPPPFEIWDVSAYAVQPDGSILVSTSDGVTYIFDANKIMWKQYGQWVFPFTGRGHYDPSLMGFVGLSKDPGTFGYLYCCSTGTGNIGKGLRPNKPAVKHTKHTVYSENPDEGQHVSATLVHVRAGIFCLVECVSIDGNTSADQLRVLPGPDQKETFMYRVKTFSLRITKGSLKLENCKVCCYRPPPGASIGTIRKDPMAFWL